MQGLLKECKDCPPGANCTYEGVMVHTIRALSGYWSASTSPEKVEFVQCVNDACAGGGEGCKDGYAGPRGCVRMCVVVILCVCVD